MLYIAWIKYGLLFKHLNIKRRLCGWIELQSLTL